MKIQRPDKKIVQANQTKPQQAQQRQKAHLQATAVVVVSLRVVAASVAPKLF